MKKIITLLVVQIIVASVSANVLWEETFDKNGSTLVVKDDTGHWPYAGGDASKNYVFTNYSTDYKEVSSYNVSVRNKKFVGAEQGTPGFYIAAGKAADQCYVKFVYDFVKDGSTMYLCFEVCSDNADGGDLSKMIIKVNDKAVEIPATTLGDKLVPVTVSVPLEAGDVTSIQIAGDNLPAQLLVSHPRIVDEFPRYVIDISAGLGGQVSIASGFYPQDTIITLTATPDWGYKFVNWSDGNTDNPRAVIVASDTTFTAEFALSYTGQCGDSLHWEYENGQLTITGTGDMYDFRYNPYDNTPVPWLFFLDSITNVALQDGMTSIGDDAFYGCTGLTSVSLPESITSIGEEAFSGCEYIADIYCYAKVPPTAYTNSTFDKVSQHCYIHIPAGTIRQYQMAPGWSNFLHYFEISELPEGTPADQVGVTVEANYATFTWPVNPTASSYTLTITKEGVVFCTLIFNNLGQLVGMAFAPARNGEKHAPAAAESTAYGYAFVVSGLEKGAYDYTFTANDSENNVIETFTGSFSTEEATAIEETTVNKYVNTATKILRDGQLLILRDGKTYNMQGAVVE